jgi:outer membrane protein assembly factor BamB
VILLHRSIPRLVVRFVWASFVGTLLLVANARAADTLTFSDLAGWWSAEPTYAGESSRVLLHFLEEDGKQSVRISLLAIGGYDVPIGTANIKGSTVEVEPHRFMLTYDGAKQTLSGHLPEAAVPVYRIPVEFQRIEAFAKPPAPQWSYPAPTIKWRTKVPGPVWAGLERDQRTGMLFVGTDAGTLHALDEAGKQRWQFETRKPIKARPAAIGEAVYVASDSGFLYKLDVRSGREAWRARIDAGSPARIPVDQAKTRWDRYGSSVVADAERVYVASRDNHLYALDLESGKERWRFASKDMATATPALYADGVLFASFDGTIYALDADSGKPRWQYDARQPISGDLLVDAERVFAGSRSYDLIALDAHNGKELWKHYYWFSWIESPPVIHGEVVYTGSSDATAVYAIDARSGARRWKTPVPGWAWARPTVDERMVVAATVGQGPHPGVREGALVGLDRDSGRIRWVHLNSPSRDAVEKKREWGFASSPVLADGIVYAADLDGAVYALDAR